MPLSTAVHRKAVELSKLSLAMTAKAGSGHPSSAISLAHIITYLMYRQMRYDPGDPWNLAADRLVLSEGHAVPIVYAAWADLNGLVCDRSGGTRRLSREDLDGLRSLNSVLDGHPNPAEGFPFFDAATGSLGQGLSVAAGLALAARGDGTPRRVYCLIGDGESREGQIWEAVDFIAENNLTNLCAIFNCNGFGQAAPVSPQQSAERIARKLEAFGYDVARIDGHNPAEIAQALRQFDECRARPLAIVARTVKGWGVKTLLEGNWHGKPLKLDQLPTAEKSLDDTLAAILTDSSDGSRLEPPRPPADVRPFETPDTQTVSWPPFKEAMQTLDLGDALAKGRLSTRRAYGGALRLAGELLPHVVALDGDVSNSTFAEMFARRFPDRFFECKIAEQNMISIAAGLAAAGKMPFVNSFAKFVARGYDQVEMANISRANLKIVGSHAGVTLAADGPSQMALLDVAYFAALTTVRHDSGEPICRFFHPADAVAAYHCTRLMTQTPVMCYMRTHRPDMPLIYNDQSVFNFSGFNVLREGTDLTLLSAGYMVHVVLEAAQKLADMGIRAGVIDAYALPLDENALLPILGTGRGRVLVVEDNYGGLTEAVARLAAQSGAARVAGLTCRRIPKSTITADEVLHYCGVGLNQVVEKSCEWARA